MRLKIIIPGLLVPIVAIAALLTGVLPGVDAALPIPGIDAGVAEPENTIVDESTTPDAQADGQQQVADTSAPTPEPAAPPAPQIATLPEADRGGHFLGRENGLVLLQTTRVDSETHQGWVDITLDVAATNFSRNPDFESGVFVLEGVSACFSSETDSSDCFSVEWGSEEQFKADLSISKGGVGPWGAQRTELLAVKFEVPTNADRASLVFGEHRLAIPLEGELHPDLSGWTPTEPFRPVPTPGAPSGSEGYLVGREYGLAVNATDRTPHPEQPTWSTITLNVDAMRFADLVGIAPTMTADVTTREWCFVGTTRDCVEVRWGDERQFSSVLRLGQESGELAWPRAKGWPTTIKFVVPNNALEATLVFGGQEAPIDLRGEAGTPPEWDYTAHYVPLTGSTLFEDDGHRLDIVAIDHDEANGDRLLLFEAINDSEILDFRPYVELFAGRVSEGGQVMDGAADPSEGWVPVTIAKEAETLAPGQSARFEATLPRVEGEGFEFVEHSEDPPEAMLVALTAGRLSAEGERTLLASPDPHYAPFDKTGRFEAAYYFPDLTVTGLTTKPTPAPAGTPVALTFLLANEGPRNASGTTLQVDVDGEQELLLLVPAIPALSTASVDTTWTVPDGPVLLDITIDPKGSIEEAITENNTLSTNFAGAMPDVLVTDFYSSTRSTTTAPLSYHLVIANRGQGTAIASRLNVFAGEGTNILFFVPTPAIEEGQTAEVSFPWVSAIGTRDIRVEIDSLGFITESNEANNVSMIPLPEFAFTPKLGVLEFPTVDGVLGFEIENSSEMPSPRVKVAVVIDEGEEEERTAEFEVGPLGPWETAAFSLPVETEGRHHFKATIDPTNIAAEADETNNVLEFDYTVGPLPDLRVIAMENRPVGVLMDETATTWVELENNGLKWTQSFTATLYETGTEVKLGEVEIPALDRAERYAFKFDWIVPEDATGVRVVLDEAEEVAEIDELNNEATAPLL